MNVQQEQAVGSKALAIIAAEHRNMRHVSGALGVLGRGFAAGRADETALHTVELIADYFEAYSNSFHHARESDVLFPRIQARTDRGGDVLARLYHDHEAAHAELVRLQHFATRPDRFRPDCLRELAAEIETFTTGLEEHLRLEEEECFPLARAVLTAEDWRVVDEAFVTRTDPLDLDNPAEAVALLRARITQVLPSPMGLGGMVDHAPVAPHPVSTGGTAMLEVDSLTSAYGRIQVLHGISLRVMPGQLVALVGANGAGKTTLLRCISGVQPATGGRITSQDMDITRMPASRRVRAGICQVPEGRHVFGQMSIEDNLKMGAYTRPAGEIADSLEEVYTLFPVLGERRTMAAGVLSGGQQQMVALGRALMGKPKILLLDEPSMGLAPLIVAEIFRVIRMLRDAGITILLVEQNAKAALSLADHAYVMETGAIVLEGPGQELLHDDNVRRAYLGM